MAARPEIAPAAIWKISQVMHEAVRAWQKANGQTPAPAWSRAPDWMKESTRAGVAWRLANPKAPPSAQHDQWIAQKKAAGWKYGRTRSGVRKTHPLMVPYADLPEVERRKDALVSAVIDALAQKMR